MLCKFEVFFNFNLISYSFFITQSLSTAVAQLLLTKSPDHIKWHVKCTGVVCFVKDNPKRSYFIRVYDFDVNTLLSMRNYSSKNLVLCLIFLAKNVDLGARIIYDI